MGDKERVILIKGDSTKWYDQVIFIVNKNMPQEKMPVDFVLEAEKIINSYIMQKKRQTNYGVKNTVTPSAVTVKPTKTVKSAKLKRFDFILNAIMLLGCLTIAGVFIFGLLG